MKRKLLVYIIIVTILGLLFITSTLVIADSGWDTSYDSGGWSSSDWDSGSSWSSSDWDDDWGYSSSSSSSDIEGLFMLQLFIIIFIIVIVSDIKKQKHNSYIPSNTFNEKSYDDKHMIAMSKIKEEIKNFDEKEFDDMVYDKYIKIQKAWSNFDFDELKSLLTDELYNTYNSQLKILKAKKEKNIMTDFERRKVSIVDFIKTNNEYTIKVLVKTRFYDYISNQHDVVLRGKKDIKVEMTYILTFVRKQIIKNNKCPNCNAPLENQHSNTCPYCKSKLVSDNYDWTLSKKEAINQRWVR